MIELTLNMLILILLVAIAIGVVIGGGIVGHWAYPVIKACDAHINKLLELNKQYRNQLLRQELAASIPPYICTCGELIANDKERREHRCLQTA